MSKHKLHEAGWGLVVIGTFLIFPAPLLFPHPPPFMLMVILGIILIVSGAIILVLVNILPARTKGG